MKRQAKNWEKILQHVQKKQRKRIQNITECKSSKKTKRKTSGIQSGISLKVKSQIDHF